MPPIGPNETALKILKHVPRINIGYLTVNPYKKIKKGRLVGQYNPCHLLPSNHWKTRQRYIPVGYEGNESPFWMTTPTENYYKNFDTRRQYPPLTMHQLQLMIDTGVIDPDEPIDLATICNSHHIKVEPTWNHFGVQLTDVGIDHFKSRVFIEVQHAKEPVIAAIEKNGGVIITAYYDIESVIALHNPLKFFRSGEPIPKRMLPPEDAIDYYTDPKNRGYLADPEKISEEREKLAQKYGYVLPNIKLDPYYEMLTLRKDPRQVFYGLSPGWVINLKDKEILEPTDELLQDYYRS